MDKPKVLLVDDSMSVITFMTTALRNAGCDVAIALEGAEALQKIMTQKFHCLVLDVILPGTNGYTICRQIRARDPQHTLPILLISTKNTPFDRNYGLSLGADYYLGKPFNEEVLVQAVFGLLPAHLRPQQTEPLQKPDARIAKLIPRRCEDPSLLTTTNPFVKKPQMDNSTRQLYLAMDGQKNVKTLCESTGLTIQQVITILNTLTAQKQVELYDPEERKFVTQNYL